VLGGGIVAVLVTAGVELGETGMAWHGRWKGVEGTTKSCLRRKCSPFDDDGSRGVFVVYIPINTRLGKFFKQF